MVRLLPWPPLAPPVLVLSPAPSAELALPAWGGCALPCALPSWEPSSSEGLRFLREHVRAAKKPNFDTNCSMGTIGRSQLCLTWK